MFDVLSTVMLGNPADPVNVAFQKAMLPWYIVEGILGVYIIFLLAILIIGFFVFATLAVLRPFFKLGGLILVGIGSLVVMIWNGLKLIIDLFSFSKKPVKPVHIPAKKIDLSLLENTGPKFEPIFDIKNMMEVNIGDTPHNIITPSATTKNLVINGYRIPLH